MLFVFIELVVGVNNISDLLGLDAELLILVAVKDVADRVIKDRAVDDQNDPQDQGKKDVRFKPDGIELHTYSFNIYPRPRIEWMSFLAEPASILLRR